MGPYSYQKPLRPEEETEFQFAEGGQVALVFLMLTPVFLIGLGVLFKSIPIH